MAEDSAFLRSDIFSRISFGIPWIDLHWGFQVLVYRIHLLGGEAALVHAKAMASALLAVLLWLPLILASKPNPPLAQVKGETLLGLNRDWLFRLAFAAPFAWLLTYHQRYLTDMRPLWLTLILLTVQALALRSLLASLVQQAQEPTQTKPNRIVVMGLLSVMGFAQIAMVNLQGLFLLGPGLMFLLTVGESFRLRGLKPGPGSRAKTVLLFAVLLTCGLIALSLINPYTGQAFTLAMRVAGRIAPLAGNIFSADMAENQPLWQAFVAEPEWVPPLVMAWALGLIVAVIASLSRPHRFHGEMLVHAACAVLAVMALRNVPLVLMSLSWWLARIFAVTQPFELPRLPSQYRGMAARITLGALYVWFLPTALSQWREVKAANRFELPGSSITPFRVPIGAADYLDRNPISGQLFNELRHGGYLAWRFADPAKNFIDGRMVLRTAEQYREVMAAFDKPETFDGLQSRYGITHVLLPLMEWERYRPLGLYLLRQLRMELLYCDGASALLALPEAVPQQALRIHDWETIEKTVRARYGAHPELAEMALKSADDFWRRSRP